MTVIKREALPAKILEILAQTHSRLIVAVAGAPGAGKSTLSASLKEAINGDEAGPAIVVPMDGFHLDDAILDQRGLKSRKGSPPTFDCAGFAALLQRLKGDEDEIFIPLFDRSLELSRAAACAVLPEHRILLVEGNYLLLDDAPWSSLSNFFDLSIFLDVPFAELEDRLVKRWLEHGFDHKSALERALCNDIPNAKTVVSRSRQADFVVSYDA